MQKILHSMTHALRSFEEKYPALWLALFFLVGIGAGFNFLISITGILLISMSRKLFPLIMMIAGTFYLSFLHPKLALEKPVKGSGIFQIHQIKRHPTPFQTLLVYEGTLLGFKTDDKTYHRLPCLIYQSPWKKRFSADHQYFISNATLLETAPHRFILKSHKDTTWTPTHKSLWKKQWRFFAKENLRKWVHKHCTNKHAARLLSGLLTGERESHLMAFQFGQVGLQHLLVISGFHFALLTFFLAALIKPILPRKGVACLLIFLLGAYFLYMGEAPSISRAWVGVLLFLSGILIGRKSSPLNGLGLALIAALISNPLVILHIGFQLSFAATLGIMLFYQPFEQALQSLLLKRSFEEIKHLTPLHQLGAIVVTYLRKVLALNGSVLTFTLPLLLFHFHRFPLLGLVYNLFIPLLFSILMAFLVLALLIPPFFALAEVYALFLMRLVTYAPKRLLFHIRVPNLPQEMLIGGFLLLFLWGIYLKWSRSVLKEWSI